MFLKQQEVVLFFALLAVAFAERPYVGLRMPHLPLTPISPQIIGGEEAPPHAYPYIVALTWWSLDGLKCGGAILNDRWILTAGHCVDDYDLGLIKAGKHNINMNENTEQSVMVERVFLHEKYQRYPTPTFDIALIKTSSLYFTNEIQPIKLQQTDSYPTGNATLCGWGATGFRDNDVKKPIVPSELRRMQLPYADRVTCHDIVMRVIGKSAVSEDYICTGSWNEKKSGCYGDSGGPLTSGNGQNRVVTGIASVVSDDFCRESTVYTRVSKYISWIEEKMRLY